MDSLPQMVVVAPAFNEQGKIGRVVEKLLAYARQEPRVRIVPVVVDDGSSDATAAEAAAAGATVLRHAANRGVGAGIRTGIQHAVASGAELTAVISGDDQHDPTEFPRLLAPILAGTCDFVQGSRWMPGGRVLNAPNSRQFSTRAYARAMSFVTGRRCTDGTNGLRLFRTAILTDKRIRLEQDCLDGYELEPYLLYKVLTLGCRYAEAPITIRYHREHGGCTKMRPIRDWWRIFRPLVYLRLGLWT